jgi:hypothetical protein
MSKLLVPFYRNGSVIERFKINFFLQTIFFFLFEDAIIIVNIVLSANSLNLRITVGSFFIFSVILKRVIFNHRAGASLNLNLLEMLRIASCSNLMLNLRRLRV